MDRRMCFVILVTFSRRTEHGSACNLVCKLPKGLVRLQAVDNLSQVDRLVIYGGLSARIAQVALIVKFFHDCHCDFGRNLKLC
jgi:hypothetical protein